ncbi:MAG: tRNA (5-methylaminomethyl-2-thiouridine)(34)-methyltransferase MnmD [Thalassobaculum sp.]
MTHTPPAPLSSDNLDPGLVLREGVPVSTRFDDVYFSREDGLAETVYVFLDGCGLPDAWKGAAGFTIAETGFGTGLNFLAAWNLWRRHRPAGGVLHYLAVEGFPIPRDRLAGTVAAFPGLSGLAARLCERYPDNPTSGFHRIWFDLDRVCLTLVIGEAADALAAAEARVDAWFLDGFAPSRNPAMWRPEVLRQVARLSAPDARLASFTAAGQVRRGLAEVGFEVGKRPGFGRKRDCIAGRFTGPPVAAGTAPWFARPEARRPDRVAVVGAGIAGAALVGALERRGIETVWLDRHGRIAAEASGNPAGLMMARPTVGGAVQGGLSAACFRYACAEARFAGLPFGGNGVLELASDDADIGRFDTLSASGQLAPIAARPVDRTEATAIAGVPLDRPGLWHSSGGWVDPRDWSRILAGANRPARYDVHRMERIAVGWRLLDRTGHCLAEVGAVAVASALGAAAMLPGAALPLEAIRGQLTRLGKRRQADDCAPASPSGAISRPRSRARISPERLTHGTVSRLETGRWRCGRRTIGAPCPVSPRPRAPFPGRAVDPRRPGGDPCRHTGPPTDSGTGVRGGGSDRDLRSSEGGRQTPSRRAGSLSRRALRPDRPRLARPGHRPADGRADGRTDARRTLADRPRRRGGCASEPVRHPRSQAPPDLETSASGIVLDSARERFLQCIHMIRRPR